MFRTSLSPCPHLIYGFVGFWGWLFFFTPIKTMNCGHLLGNAFLTSEEQLPASGWAIANVQYSLLLNQPVNNLFLGYLSHLCVNGSSRSRTGIMTPSNSFKLQAQDAIWIRQSKGKDHFQFLNYDEFEFHTVFNSFTRNICWYSSCNNQEQQEQ